MASTKQLDHTVINVGFEMDAAKTVFANLGFTLTPRGHHSTGSINHLAIFLNNILLTGVRPLAQARDTPRFPRTSFS